MNNDDVKKYIDISKLYTEVELDENKKVDEGILDWLEDKLGINKDEAEEVVKEIPPKAKTELDAVVDDNKLSDKTAQDNNPNIQGNNFATDADGNVTSTDKPKQPGDGDADAQAGKSFTDIGQAMLGVDQLKVGDKVTIGGQEATVYQTNDGVEGAEKEKFFLGANGKPIGAAATAGDAGQDNNPNTDGGQERTTSTGQDNNPNAEAEPQAEPVNTKDLMTRYNEGGKKAMPEIKKLQTELSRLGFDPNGIDGKYGNGTFKAVQDFQKANGLQVDGQAGTDTLAAIKKAITGDGPGKGEAGAGDGAGQSAQASNDAQATDDGMTDAEREAGAGKGGGADAMDPKNQQQDIDTAQPNADLDRYIALLNKLEGGQVNAGTPDATQGKVFASYDFRDLIALVESNLLNEKLTPAEMEELKSLHNKVQGHVGIPGMDDQKIVNALNRYLKLVKEPADKKADAQTKASDAQLIAKGQAAKADAQNKASDAQLIAKAQAAQPKVSKELYVQMPPNRKASLGNFNVSKMKAKYPKPYVDIPNKDGTITRGYGPLKNLEDFVANQGKKFKAKIIGKPAQQAGVPNAERDGAERGVQTASKDNNMKKAIEEASMNISINGDSAAEVAELAGILKNAGMHDAKPVSDIMPHAGNSHDDMMSKMAIVNEPEMDSPCGMDEEGVEEDWDNSPDESYADTQTMTHDLSGGINRQKKAYAKAQDGDNAMAVETSIKEQLWAALNEKMTAEGRGRGKTLKASRGEKLNASRGNKLMASRGKDKKTTEGSRGKKSRGKKSRG